MCTTAEKKKMTDMYVNGLLRNLVSGPMLKIILVVRSSMQELFSFYRRSSYHHTEENMHHQHAACKHYIILG